MKYFCPFRLVLLLYLVATSLISTSCGNSPKRSSTSDDNRLEATIVKIVDIGKTIEKDADIPIAINLAHTEDEDMKQLVDAEYEVTYETDNDIYIDINSGYYKQYTSGTRFKADQLSFFENSENVEYLTMTLDVVNNTNKRLSINELNVIVEDSKPDTLPIIYICTTEDYSNCLYFVLFSAIFS